MRNPNRQSAIATRQFFEWLELRFGSGNQLPMDSSQVVTRKSLELQDLQDLFQQKITALHILNYYPRASAQNLGNQLAFKTNQAKNWKVSTSQGLESSDVFTLGKHDPYNIAVATGTLDEYFTNVTKELQSHRRENKGGDTAKAKLLWPLDLLRLELDEIWPYGAGLERGPGGGELCKGGGLARIMMGPTRWKKGFIHVDELAPLSTCSGTFSANIYLQLPEISNREPQPILEIWPLGIYSKWDWYRVRLLPFWHSGRLLLCL